MASHFNSPDFAPTRCVRPVLQRGFTLVELLASLAIVSVLLVLAVPSLRGLLDEEEISSSVNTFVYSLQLARSEAVKRSAAVALCPSANALESDASCSTTSGYSAGWVVFIDADSDGVRDSGETLLLQQIPNSGNFNFTPGTTFADRVFFDSTGAISTPSGSPLSGDFGIAHKSGSPARTVKLSANGRISTETPP